MAKPEKLQCCIETILTNLAKVDEYGYTGNEAKAEVETLLNDLWEQVSEVNSYYRDKYSIGKLSPADKEKAMEALRLRDEGLSGDEIRKRLRINRQRYYHLLAQYRQENNGEW